MSFLDPLNSIRASFWRGGTSKGLIFLASRLAPFTQPTREAIICSAMGSPDPDGRQIDGLGGGASSLSKVAIINAPGRGGVSQARKAGNRFPGVLWSEDGTRASDPTCGWDLVYRFGQVPINGTQIDWSSTCGNLVAAVAQHAIGTQTLDGPFMRQQALNADVDPDDPTTRFMCPVRIFQAESGHRVLASVAVTRGHHTHWTVDAFGETSIAGVPGKHASTVIETPLVNQLLPTSRATDSVNIGSANVEVSIVDAGLPVIFVRASDLGVDIDQLTSHPVSLDADVVLMQRVEALRTAASALSPSLTQLCFPGSAAPKVCLLHQRAAYISTGGAEVPAEEIHCLARAVSVGQFHRTIPATTLSALGAASTMDDTVVSAVIKESLVKTQFNPPPWAVASDLSAADRLISISVGQPAGVSSTCLRMSNNYPPAPEAVLMERTARMIMDGNVTIPESLGVEVYAPFVDLYDERGESVPPPSSPRLGFMERESRRAKRNAEVFASKVKVPSPSSSGVSQIREYATATVVGEREPMTQCARIAKVHLYRYLYRAIIRHPTLYTPARKNLHRAIKDDFVAAAASLTLTELEQRVQATLLLLMSASRQQVSLSREAVVVNSQPRSLVTEYQPKYTPALPLAQRVLINLASLTYHYLSPNTAMISKLRPRLSGGSDSSSARLSRAQSASAPSESERLATRLLSSFDGDLDKDSPGRRRREGGKGGKHATKGTHDGSFDAFASMSTESWGTPLKGSQEMMEILSTPARPIRGPVTAGNNNGDDRLLPWDGQRSRRNLDRLPIEEEQALLEAHEAGVLRQLNDKAVGSEKAQAKVKAKRLADLVEVRGLLKGVRKKHKAEQEAIAAKKEVRRMLMEVVRGVEFSTQTATATATATAIVATPDTAAAAAAATARPTGAFVGAARWQKWLNGEFLPP